MFPSFSQRASAYDGPDDLTRNRFASGRQSATLPKSLESWDRRFRDFCDYAVTALGHSAATLHGYRHAYRDFRRYVEESGATLPGAFLDVEGWVRRNRRRGLGPVTVNTYWRQLRPFFNDLERRDGVESPFRHMKAPTQPARIAKAFKPTDCRKILVAAESYPWPTAFQRTRAVAVIATILYAGLRRGELLRLTYADVSLDDGTIRILRGKERRPHGCTPACVKKPYSGTTINDAVHVLRVVIGWAVELDVLDGSPVKKKVKWARQSLPELELTLDERRRFLAAFEDEALFRAYLARTRTPPKIVPHPAGGMKRVGGGRLPDGKAAKEIFRRLQHYRPFFWTLLDTGLRLSDALNLRWGSVSLEENVLRVVTQKKDKPVTLPLSDVVRTALETLKKRPVISEFVFLDEDDRPLTKEKVSRRFAMAKAVAGITRRFRIHDLRHTFASTLVSSGVNLKVVSDLLGHTDIATTARYARGDHRALGAVAKVLNRVNVDVRKASSVAPSPREEDGDTLEMVVPFGDNTKPTLGAKST